MLFFTVFIDNEWYGTIHASPTRTWPDFFLLYNSLFVMPIIFFNSRYVPLLASYADGTCEFSVKALCSY